MSGKALVLQATRLLPAMFILLVWQLAASTNGNINFFYGNPSEVFSDLANDLQKNGLGYDITVTVTEAVTGLVLGSLGGLLISVLLSLSPRAAFVSAPYVTFLGSIPIVAIAPLMILWFGAGWTSSVAIATLSTILLSVGQVFEGLRGAMNTWSRLAISFNANRARFFRYIILPAATTWVFSSWRAATGLALIGAFVGEFVSADRGLGRYILRAGSLYDASRVFGGILVIGLVALLLTGMLYLLEVRLMPWKRFARSQE